MEMRSRLLIRNSAMNTNNVAGTQLRMICSNRSVKSNVREQGRD